MGRVLTVCCGDNCLVPIHQVISGGGYPPVAWHVTILDFPSLTYVGFSRISNPVGGTEKEKNVSRAVTVKS